MNIEHVRARISALLSGCQAYSFASY